eukprot:TRINITY_DN46623_c0_g1_i1.p2 TRINITY_DN46623_c0_g1~~TRINITY_DN46623_c0_g1_i1.p2  ORF type:complete len:162 (+),score=58.40 TRINITY_DN46623_c0_g1_i1:92-577(+)
MAGLRLTDEDIKECFNLYDTDGSGYLDKEEVRFALRSLGWEQVSDKDVNEFMSAADASNDGKISLDEFESVMKQKMLESGSDAEIQHMFKVFDFDRNGRIGVKDLERIAEKVNAGLTTQQVSELINWGDFDQDGQLNYEEFYHAVTKYQCAFDPRLKRTQQ